METLINQYIQRYKEAKSKKDFDSIKNLVSILNNSELKVKEECLPLYEQIYDEMFATGRGFRNLDLKRFQQSIKVEKSEILKSGGESKKETIQKTEEISLDSIFINFFNNYFERIKKLKDYYFLRLENTESNLPAEILFICDDQSYHNPIINSITESTYSIKLNRLTFDDFNKNIADNTIPKKNYICICIITPQLNSSFNLKNQLGVFFECFSVVSLYKLNNSDSRIDLTNISFESNIEKIINLIYHESIVVFNNEKLSNEEQKIIKLFFDSKTPIILDYKVLKPGASGSSVIEIQGANRFIHRTKRFVFKLAKIEQNKPRKLDIEKKNFDEFVKPTITNSYTAEYKSNEQYDAIQYNYASTNSLIDSYSFNELLENYLWPKQNTSTDFQELRSVIENLLSSELFQNWSSTQEKTSECGLLYQQYIDNETKIFEAFKEICLETKESDELIERFNRLKKFKLETKEKICHGDLHSENFFWDKSKVYLIDFGFTSMHHSIIDHAFLEASIRFKNFPRYLTIEEIENYEKNLLSISSFHNEFSLDFVKREKIKGLFELIKLIRIDSARFFKSNNSPLEYLIALYFISCRLCRYKDLNQVYALKMVDILGKKIEMMIALN